MQKYQMLAAVSLQVLRASWLPRPLILYSALGEVQRAKVAVANTLKKNSPDVPLLAEGTPGLS